MKAHLRRHQLEQLVADDPRSPVMPVLRVHVGACDICGTRRRALEAARSHFVELPPPLDFAREVLERASQPEPDAKRGWFGRAFGATLIALFTLAGILAAVWLVLGRIPGLPETPPPAPAAAVTFEVLAQMGGGTHALKNGDAVAPGPISFEYSLDRPQHLLLLGIDDAGSITRYYPISDESPPLGATPRARLPMLFDAEGRDGQERLYALFSDEPIDEVAASAALAHGFAAAGETGGGITAMGEVDLAATQVTVWFRRP